MSLSCVHMKKYDKYRRWQQEIERKVIEDRNRSLVVVNWICFLGGLASLLAVTVVALTYLAFPVVLLAMYAKALLWLTGM